MAKRIGNSSANVLNGTNGDDVINGRGGNDTLRGRDGSDVLIGGTGKDKISTGENDPNFGDYVRAGPGSDVIDFGGIKTGWVSLNHEDLKGPIKVMINGAKNKGTIDAGGQGKDKLVDVANPLDAGWTTGGLSVRGTDKADTFKVKPGKEQWMEVVGLGGNDMIDISGKGLVRVSYHFSDGKVKADLGKGVVKQDGFRDKIKGDVFELRASDSADTLNGSNGNDKFIGRGGNDKIDGKGGFDRVRHDRFDSTDGIDADLAKGTIKGEWKGKAFTHAVKNIEWVRGTNFNDEIKGSNRGETLDGREGRDLLVGRGGKDTLNGEGGNDTLTGGGQADRFVFTVGSGKDRITDFEDDVDSIAFFGLGGKKAILNTATEVGNNVVFDFGGGDKLTVLNTTIAEISDDILT